jgi:hypothetical protein
MKRTLASALIVGVSLFGFAGCGEESKIKEKETVTSPGGKTETTTEKSVKSTGDNPPANSEGQTGKTAEPPK